MNYLKKRKKITPSSGFTLLEVLVAVVIMGSTLAVLLGAVNRNLVLASDSKNLSIARMLAQNKISEIELEGYPSNKEEEGEFEDFPGFKWYLTVVPLSIAALETDLKIVRLLVTWDNDEHDFEITLAMSDHK
ncbi:MAG: prepilin-type N-terminal cleavage/methylation domain-containing protein [Candidatus Dadabacteria bacterium]|nr:prepilin-type N-terminal cleavage/methylation domain-containing protein [Candidatus Dadabacteria bacterium]